MWLIFFAKYKTATAWKSCIKQIASYVVLNYERRAFHGELHGVDVEVLPGAEMSLERYSASRTILDALADLPPDVRASVKLLVAHRNGSTLQELAEAQGTSVDALRCRFNRLPGALRAWLRARSVNDGRLQRALDTLGLRKTTS
ncbi:MAG: hypothetical protein JW940_35710 [Polyangiaceae bacterium]|nr:hypothetical protein [Polyangiaceae bacterium]